jgi:hypothetical protein
MGKKSTPASPDYKGAAEATAASDKEALEYQTQANRPNQYNPWGSVEWSQDDQGNWSQRQTLTGDTQSALDSQLALQRQKSDLGGSMFGRMKDEYGQAMDWGQFGDAGELRQSSEDAAYGRATSRLDPRFEQEGQSLEIKLRNRGLTEGDAAYDSAMKNFNMQKEDAYSNARNQAVSQGRDETKLGATLRQNQMAEEMQKRGFSLNEMNAIMSGQQVSAPSFQNFNQAGRGQATDYSGAAMNQSNFDQMSQQSGMGGMMDIANMGISAYSAGMFCDRRLKRNINRIGEYLGYPLYIFEYIWGEIAVGVMSDEINQEAVCKHSSGYDWVNYDNIIPMGDVWLTTN